MVGFGVTVLSLVTNRIWIFLDGLILIRTSAWYDGTVAGAVVYREPEHGRAALLRGVHHGRAR